jgi:AcrR family transcriptional regulator
MGENRAANLNRRSERARRAIHAATRELVCERGFANVTVESIATRAGVGKQTIYRWWPSKCAVVLDVLVADNMHDGEPPPIPDTGDLAADLRSVLAETVEYFTDRANDNLLRAMTAEIQYDEDLAANVLDQLLRPQFDAIVARIRTAGLTTPTGSAVDPEIVAEELVGPIFHRWLLRRAPLNEDYVNHLVDHVIGTTSQPPGRRRGTEPRGRPPGSRPRRLSDPHG